MRLTYGHLVSYVEVALTKVCAALERLVYALPTCSQENLLLVWRVSDREARERR